MLMKQAGAAMVVTERVDAADVARRDRRALRLLYTQPCEAPCAGADQRRLILDIDCRFAAEVVG